VEVRVQVRVRVGPSILEVRVEVRVRRVRVGPSVLQAAACLLREAPGNLARLD